MRRDPGSDLARAITFVEGLARRAADETEPFRWGAALFTTSIPDIWDHNFLLVEQTSEEISAPGLVAETDRIMAPRGYEHRKVVVHDAALGDRLAPGFKELGWDATELVWMAHLRSPVAAPDVPVDEMAEAAHTRARDEFNRRDPYVAGEEVVRQLRDAARLTSRVTDKRCFGAYVDDVVAAVCELYSDGVTAQIEDVATLAEYRGRGLATAVVLRALHEAEAWGHDLIFLCADNNDWPKELYAKLGFGPIGRTYQFLLRPPGAPRLPE